jgi:hypothetical protein
MLLSNSLYLFPRHARLARFQISGPAQWLAARAWPKGRCPLDSSIVAGVCVGVTPGVLAGFLLSLVLTRPYPANPHAGTDLELHRSRYQPRHLRRGHA